MFAVFGITREVIAKEARKKMETFRVNKARPTQQQWEEEFERVKGELKEKMKPKQLSQKLSSPALARQYLDMTKLQTWSRDLSIRVQVIEMIEVDGKLKPVLSKTTKRPRLKWISMAEYEKQLKAIA